MIIVRSQASVSRAPTIVWSRPAMEWSFPLAQGVEVFRCRFLGLRVIDDEISYDRNNDGKHLKAIICVYVYIYVCMYVCI